MNKLWFLFLAFSTCLTFSMAPAYELSKDDTALAIDMSPARITTNTVVIRETPSIRVIRITPNVNILPIEVTIHLRGGIPSTITVDDHVIADVSAEAVAINEILNQTVVDAATSDAALLATANKSISVAGAAIAQKILLGFEHGIQLSASQRFPSSDDDASVEPQAPHAQPSSWRRLGQIMSFLKSSSIKARIVAVDATAFLAMGTGAWVMKGFFDGSANLLSHVPMAALVMASEFAIFETKKWAIERYLNNLKILNERAEVFSTKPKPSTGTTPLLKALLNSDLAKKISETSACRTLIKSVDYLVF